jgi:hypothetical protein
MELNKIKRLLISEDIPTLLWALDQTKSITDLQECSTVFVQKIIKAVDLACGTSIQAISIPVQVMNLYSNFKTLTKNTQFQMTKTQVKNRNMPHIGDDIQEDVLRSLVIE